MATHTAAVSAQNLRKRGCAAAATATPTGSCTHGPLSCSSAEWHQERRELRGESYGAALGGAARRGP